MILAFTVTLDISNPMRVIPSDELREEYRENIEVAIGHRLHNIGFSGELIDEVETSVREVTVAPLDIP